MAAAAGSSPLWSCSFANPALGGITAAALRCTRNMPSACHGTGGTHPQGCAMQSVVPFTSRSGKAMYLQIFATSLKKKKGVEIVKAW